MDGYEAIKIVFSRIQKMDPENASKIMGVLLIQDHGEKEMIRLAFGPETLVHSVILKAKKELGLLILPSNNNNSPPTPSSSSTPPSPFLSRQNRLSLTIANPSLPTLSEFQNQQQDDLPFYTNGGSDPVDDFQLQDQLSFLNDGDMFYSHSDMSSSPTSYGRGGSLHKRSCSVNDACLVSEDPNSGLGWKPCLYFARGYCKNGTSCRFLHGGGLGDVDSAAVVGSPEQCHELFRSKSSQQQRLSAAASASQLMASSALPYSPKCMSLLLQQQQQNDTQRAAAAALMMSEDLHKFGRSSRLERNDFSLNSPTGMISPASRQIYLTFPADSTFREEDVSNYFSIYGPVQDVRIPYQQKRMFGFVTFVYPETVKLILSKGNPHFVCDARVLVKPYKEKGKVPDKKQQQMDRGDFSPCGTPTGLFDARDQYDLQLGGRLFYNTQDMLWRRNLEEQVDLQQALELQSRRLMGLQLLDIKKQHQRAFSTGSPIPSPTHSPNIFNQNHVLPSFHRSSESPPEENGLSSAPAGQQPVKVVNGENGYSDGNGNGKLSSNHEEENDLQECLDLEHNLPNSPFASPTKASGNLMTSFSNELNIDLDDSKFGTSTLLPTSSPALDMASFKSFNCQIPRFSTSGHGTIGMFAGNGGPIGI